MIDTVEAEGAYRFEAFTNGTVEYPDWAFDQVNLVVDWKLPGSGECFPDGKMKRPQLEHARWQNLHRMMNSGMHALKYTVASEADFTVAFRHFYETKGLSDAPLEVFIGIVWDKEITNEELVELMLQYEVPWRLNVQVHNHVWDRSQRGI